ncbi:MAG TPA: type VI secretion system tip protein TssI/VgrG [Polyangium sp.]|nr:type VI secretion system tip protein TssI/VgrG [Polyangium sp.]
MAHSFEPRTHFELRVGQLDFGRLTVVNIAGEERISRPFAFDVVAYAPAQGLDEGSFERDTISKDAVLRIAVPDQAPRIVRGVITRVRAEGAVEQDRVAFRLRIAPRLALCRLNQRSRIFQDRTFPEIVTAVLAGHGIPCRFDLLGPQPRRAYCVQHRESDLAFVQRLAAEAGIFYHFECPGEGTDDAPEVVVFGDAPPLYPRIPGSEILVFRRADGATALTVREDQVTRFTRHSSAATEGTLVRDHDFRKPTAELRASAGKAEGLVVYEHHGEDEEPEIEPARAITMLEQRRARAALAEGTTYCRRLSPGHRFTLEDHDIPALNGDYVVVRAVHEGHDPQHAGTNDPVFTTTFRAAPAAVAVRPKKPRRTMRQVMETATVVGPSGQEIHTDPYGRIKVQFHWDLEGERDEHSSCWIRIAQAWAGTGWGFQFVPRVGMEVLVGFLGGDLDRPVVMGCLNDATHPPTFKLPDAKTRSGIRTQSTPGGGGYNEIAFEDRAGAEEISLHAQKDLRETIENDHDETVTHDKTVTIGGKHVLRVQGDRDDHVAGALVQTIVGGATVSVSGGMAQTTGGDAASEVRGSRAEVVHGSEQHTVHGDHMTVVMGQSVLRVEAEHAVVVGEGRDDGIVETNVSGKWIVSAGKTARIQADQGISLVVGDSVVEILSDRIVLRARRVEIEGQESVAMTGKGPAVRLGEEAEIVSKVLKLYGETSSIELDRDASVKGTRVLLNCKDSRPKDPTRDEKELETVNLRLQLTDENFEPYAGKLYDLTCEGFKCDGTTGPDGRVVRDVPKDAQMARITLWLGEDRTGPKREYSVKIGALPDIASVAGAQVRLKNLGYYVGAGRGEIDDETRAALAWFQRDHELEASGALDEATQRTLLDVHGN